MSKAWHHELAALLVLGAAALLAGRPWACSGDQVFIQRDALFSLLAVEHLQEVLVGSRPWDAAWLGWPMQPGFAQADWMAGQALLARPLAFLGMHPLDVYELLVLLGLLATAWACHRTASALLGPGPHTWLAGIIGGLGPLQLSHAQHLNLVHHEWAVGGGLVLALGLTRQRPRVAALGGLLLGLSFQFGLYMGLHAALVGFIVLAVGVVARRPGWRCALASIGGAALGLSLFLPVALAYTHFAATQGATLDPGEVVAESWDLAATLGPMVDAWLHRPLVQEGARRLMDPPNPGYSVLLLAGIGLWQVRRGGWAWASIALVGTVAALLALGPRPAWGGEPIGVPGPYALLSLLPVGDALRAPARWLALANIAAGLLAAAGVMRLTLRLPGALRPVLVVVCALAVLGETPTAESGSRQQLEPPLLYADLDAVPEGPVYEHFQPTVDGCGCEGSPRLAAAIAHGRPLVGGRWARETPALRELENLAGRWPAAEAAELIRILGVPVVIEHPPVLGPPPQGAACQRVDVHRLCVVEPLYQGGLPDETAVEPLGTGPVVGLRFLSPPTQRRLEIRCERERPWRTSTRPWRLVASLRHGQEPPWVDVYLPTACATLPEVSEGSPLPLYRVHD